MPLLETKGVASAQGFGLTLQQARPVYVEDVFSAYTYTGDSTYRGIQNDVNLGEFGGAVIVKQRSGGGSSFVTDNTINPDGGFSLTMDTQNARQQNFNFAGFYSNGFIVWSPGPFGFSQTNVSGATYTSWTFRKQPKFFDVITWVGDGGAQRTVSHSLGVRPALVIAKAVTSTSGWAVSYRVGTSGFTGFQINGTSIPIPGYTFNPAAVDTATTVRVSDAQYLTDLSESNFNASGVTYVAYLFASDAGGFGTSGTDNVITCGIYTDSGSGTQTINLGYEPQWVMRKRVDGGADNWTVVDSNRGMAPAAQASTYGLNLNSTSAEFIFNKANTTATGFQWTTSGVAGNQFLYLAVRRGPMRVPTTGSSVFRPDTWSQPAGQVVTTNFPIDMQMSKRAPEVENINFQSRLISLNTTTSSSSSQSFLITNGGGRTSSSTGLNYGWNSSGFLIGSNLDGSLAGYGWSVSFRRAPGFFDIAYYVGTGINNNQVPHQLGVVPELILAKASGSGASSDEFWGVWFTNGVTGWKLNTNERAVLNNPAYATNTATTFSANNIYGEVPCDASGTPYTAYLFASCPGVSKVGSYTGNGSSQTINCGFTGGARFVLIKRIDSSGNWTIFDSSRGIVAGNDPALYLNSNAAQLTTVDAVDADSTGFVVNQTDPLFLNVNGATYMFLAIA